LFLAGVVVKRRKEKKTAYYGIVCTFGRNDAEKIATRRQQLCCIPAYLCGRLVGDAEVDT